MFGFISLKEKIVSGASLLLAVMAIWQGLHIAELKSRLSTKEVEVAQAKLQLQVVVANHEKLVASAATEALAAKQRYDDLVKKSQEIRKKEVISNENVASSIDAGNNRVRDSVSTYVERNSTETSDSTSSCIERSKAMGLLLVEAMQLATDATKGAEQCGTDVRTLLSVWPRDEDVKTDH